MPTEIISTDITVTGFGNVGRTLGDNDLLIVRSTGSLTSEEGRAVLMSGGASLRVEGMVFRSDGNFVTVRTEGADGSTIDVAAGGSIFGARDNAVFQLNAFTTISNAGSIVSDAGIGIQVNDGMMLTNTGQIRAADVAISVAQTAVEGTILNSGVIQGGAGPGTGLEGSAMFLLSAETSIVNTGTIESLGFAGRAILLSSNSAAAATFRVENHGTIRSVTAEGIDASSNTRDALFVINTGLITGLTAAILGTSVNDTILNSGVLTVTTAAGVNGVQLGDGNDVLRNSGLIDTRVDLGTGRDIYDGRLAVSGAYILGNAGNDLLRGGVFDDSLYGGDDDDRVLGGSGDDELFESAGFDSLFGGEGRDDIGVFGNEAALMSGGAGDDSLTGSFGADTLYGGAGDDSMAGGDGNDRYLVDSAGDEVIETGTGGTADLVQSGTLSLDLNAYANVEDALLTGTAALMLTGTGVANTLTGNAGANRIAGGGGADTLSGGSGNDQLQGGNGVDSLTGGAGADRFIFASAAEAGLGANGDRITDFVRNLDLIDLSGFAGLLLFRGAAALTGANQVSYNQTTGVLSGSTDADAAAEWSITLVNRPVLTAVDFIL